MKSIKQKNLHNLSTIIYKRMFDKIVHSKKPMHFIKKKTQNYILQQRN